MSFELLHSIFASCRKLSIDSPLKVPFLCLVYWNTDHAADGLKKLPCPHLCHACVRIHLILLATMLYLKNIFWHIVCPCLCFYMDRRLRDCNSVFPPLHNKEGQNCILGMYVWVLGFVIFYFWSIRFLFYLLKFEFLWTFVIHNLTNLDMNVSVVRTAILTTIC